MSDDQSSAIGRRRAAARGEGRIAYAERRQEIVEAAARLFKTHGFRGTSIGQIADAMGTDRATLYYYVGSKEELFDEVVSDVVRAIRPSPLAAARRRPMALDWSSLMPRP